jgi:hypothetical protein
MVHARLYWMGCLGPVVRLVVAVFELEKGIHGPENDDCLSFQRLPRLVDVLAMILQNALLSQKRLSDRNFQANWAGVAHPHALLSHTSTRHPSTKANAPPQLLLQPSNKVKNACHGLFEAFGDQKAHPSNMTGAFGFVPVPTGSECND